MKFVIVTHAYDAFLAELYGARPDLASASFAAQRQAYYETLFGSADFYAHALRRLGHDCEEFVYNAVPMQRAWQREQAGGATVADAADSRGIGFAASAYGEVAQLVRRVVSDRALRPLQAMARPLRRRINRLWGAFLEQVRAIRPDVLYIQSAFAFADDQLAELRKHAGRIIGQHAATPLPNAIDYRLYDLVMSSFPPTIDYLRSRGARAELVRLAFDPRVGDRVPEMRRDRDVTFSGSLFGVHSSRLRLLEGVAAAFPQLDVHAATALPLGTGSPLDGRVRPPVWGRSMYELLRRSVATLNHHGDILPFANNMRLYEATGMGCLLVTDRKDNLGDMFEPEKEVVTYGDATECVDKLRFYLAPANAASRASIMQAGQRRTLSEHSYDARMRQMLAALSA
jgi:spore maturation protein CgeB